MGGHGGGGWPPPDPTNTTVAVEVRVGAAMGAVSDRFVSYNLDTGWTDRWNFTDPTLLLLTRALGPAHLRVGGTGEDYVVYAVGPDFAGFDCAHPPKPMTPYRCTLATESDFTALFGFAAAVNATVLFGLNDMFGRPTKTKPERPLCSDDACPQRNLTNAAALIRWAAATGVVRDNLHAWELGNELNTALNGAEGARTQAQDLAALAEIVSGAWTAGDGIRSAPPPRLCGPDTHSFTEYESEGLTWLHEWGTAVTGSGGVDPSRLITTFHMYAIGSGSDPGIEAKFLDATSLEKIGVGVRAIQAAVGPTASAELWAGETAAANNGGKEGVTDTFLDTFWYADQLGQFAREGVKVFQRQVLLATAGYPLILKQPNGSFSPTPDYWLAVLFSRLVGSTVLNVTVAGNGAAARLRAYAHCSRQPDEAGAGVTLLLINLSPDTLSVSTGALAPPAASRQEWHLTPGPAVPGLSRLQSRDVLLNGEPLEMLRGPSLPSLAGSKVDGGGAVVVAAQSIVFAQVRDAGGLCGGGGW